MSRRDAGWRRLRRHSYRLCWRWARAELRHAGSARRAGLYRLLVPLEPWRVYELGVVAEQPVSGDVLDVSSPKLLASLLASEGRGRWTAIDLHAPEIDLWRRLDPALDLRVADARALPFPDESFDTCICVSVVEHIPQDGDTRAMDEIRRVLRPGGVLHLTTNVAHAEGRLLSARPRYGVASEREDDGWFFERRYSAASLERRLLRGPWERLATEFVVERLPIHRAFFGARPLSFALGGLLGPVCARNVRVVDGPDDVPAGTHGVAYLRLRKPVAAPTSPSGSPGRR